MTQLHNGDDIYFLMDDFGGASMTLSIDHLKIAKGKVYEQHAGFIMAAPHAMPMFAKDVFKSKEEVIDKLMEKLLEWKEEE